MGYVSDYRTYIIAKGLAQEDPPFYALIMAAMRRADTDNLRILTDAFPEVWNDLDGRYNAPGGILDHDRVTP